MTKIKFPKDLLTPIEQYLESRLKLLKIRLKNVEDEDPFNDPDRAIDNAAMDTEAEEQFGHDMSVALKEELEEKIKQTSEAIDRIKKGEYGYCNSCGKMINTDRLMVYPEAISCVSCREKGERKKS